jgi:Glycosyl hydrolase family 9/Bacterial Ig domain/Cellulase N-terminal ig-like domain
VGTVRISIKAITGAVLSALAVFSGGSAEPTWDYAVQVSATAETSPAKVTLNWPQDSQGTPNNYIISRKAPNGTSWQSLATLPGSTTSYTDTSVSVGTAYEYQVQKVTSGYNGYGYVCAGLNAPLVENRGTVVLVVENQYAANLATELTRLQQDLVGDGWNVVRKDVSRTDSVPSVKDKIRSVYAADPSNVKAVFLFGHVPVPYSGNIVPDGHYPDHQGAWPADAYYGDMDGSWTDNSVNNTGAAADRNRNVPGDGKFDQSDLPSAVELQVGRVDMANMPGRLVWGGPATFPAEVELLRNYLNKDHKFRVRELNPPRRAVLHDSFGVRGGEAFAASGYRSLSALLGASAITTLYNKGEWIPNLKANEYLWAYGCGAGSFTSIGGLGNTGQYQDGTTPELVQADIHAVFTMLFGSWLGDWDSEDNIMRGVLATQTEGLTSCWSGRPHWFYHHMGIGENIGYSARLTQNNGSGGLYRNQINSAAGQIHVALMGDPTLRMHPVVPPSGFVATGSAGGASLRWNASSDSVVGYHVYRGASASGPFTRVTSSPVTGTSYTDAGGPASATYMVRAIKLENTTSGSYYNPSQGSFATLGSGTYDPGSGGTTPPTTGGGTTNPPTPGTSSGPVWVDDAVPIGAQAAGDGGDNWSWVSSNPAPYAGASAHQSVAAQGLHQHYFDWASQTLSVGAGDILYTYVYLDPANPPTELMLQWNNGSWDHRAFWGADSILYGVKGTDSRRQAGALPAAGQWVRLEVPASQVGLEGSTLRGMAFSAFNGKVTWDAAGKGVAGTSSGGSIPPTVVTNTTPVTSTVWVEDSLPTGASVGSDGGDSWNWINSNPSPNAGTLAHQSASAQGLHQHYFDWTTKTLSVAPGEVLYTYVYLDAANPPTEIMLQWNDGTWEHRAFWGADSILYGTSGSNSRRSMGALPAAGKWVRLEVPASKVGLEGSNIRGMAFSAYNGKVAWDSSGKATGVVPTDNLPPTIALTAPAQNAVLSGASSVVSATASDNIGVIGVQFKLNGANLGNEDMTTPYTTTIDTTALANGSYTLTAIARDAAGNQTTTSPVSISVNNSTAPPPPATNSLNSTFVWVDDATPSGAVPGSDGGDSWNWVNSNPAPFSGNRAHQTSASAGLHQHYFDWASQTMPVASGDILYTYVYLDPANLPSELMLQWNDGTWEHRAYWGENTVTYGSSGSNARRYMGALPASGRWVRLEVPASQVGLEGSTVRGMAFTLYNGRATWDAAGKGTVSAITTTSNTPPVASNIVDTATNSLPDNSTNIVDTGTNSLPDTSTNGTGTATNGSGSSSNAAMPSTVNVVDYTSLEMPRPGNNTLHILSPTLLELVLINTKQPDPARVDKWDLVNANGQFVAPSTSDFQVKVGGNSVNVQGVGFKRRPLYAPLVKRDLRIENHLYLQLSSPIADNQAVVVNNQSQSLWASSMVFSNVANPLRYSPAIHVNQEGYMPNFAKKAMVGYYAGNLGEMDIAASSGFKIVDAASGAQVFQGSLALRPDVGYNVTPAPYRKVLVADFSNFNTPGEYRLVVPGLGASLPFLIDNGIAMDFARTYALGLYHQRCGSDNKMPFTRHVHNVCHAGKAEVPSPASSYAFTWTTIASKTADYASNPRHTAPQLKDEASQLYPFINKGQIDVSKGHHDAGDYSKYTINTAGLIHYLMFAVDSFAGVASLDNMGIPESGDGISDLMQIAKWEADYIAKLQDADGGFYFLVYPKTREYESNVTPDNGDTQVVWPKNTAVTAAAVAALAQTASSPKFKQQYPAEAALYLQKAQLGWQFLLNAIAKYGKDGSYQKVTHYGDMFMHDDELAWAACQMYLATGDPAIHQKLMEWFPDPSDPATFRWGWWRLYESYGRAVRSYAFAARSGRLNNSQLNGTYLAKCEQQVTLAAQDHVTRANNSAYGSSFPLETKAVNAAGWYFSSERAFDITVAYQLSARADFMEAILSNLNYEGGCNPVNVSYVTGLGWKRQREIVHQYAQNDRRVMPPAGIPLGNVQDGFPWINTYQGETRALCYPSDSATTGYYPFYDRWADTFNVSTEFVNIDQSRSLASLAFVAALTPLKSQPWTSATGQISVAPDPDAPGRFRATMTVAGMDLNGARIVWEAQDQEPAYGLNFAFTPKGNGSQWVEAEAQWPDGRRVVAATTFNYDNPIVTWVDDDVPEGAVPGADGGDFWNWVSSSPNAAVGTVAHQSAIAAGQHQHWFDGAASTLSIAAGDVLFAWVYIDPANPAQEIMLQWNESGGNWDHRAYWGANKINYGTDGTLSRRNMGAIPTAGQWVRLQIPASQVGLEGKTVRGLAFSAYGGRVTWDAAGKASASALASLMQTQIVPGTSGVNIAWDSSLGRTYRLSYKNSLTQSNWIVLNSITATGIRSMLLDTDKSSGQRFYMVATAD